MMRYYSEYIKIISEMMCYYNEYITIISEMMCYYREHKIKCEQLGHQQKHKSIIISHDHFHNSQYFKF